MNPKPFKIYIAGPDVFRADLSARTKHLNTIAKQYGMEILAPAENMEVKAEVHQFAEHIFLFNVDLIKKADAIVADFSPWRGLSLDAGTAWELGMAFGLGLPAAGYGPTGDYRSRFTEELVLDEHNILRNQANEIVEDFGLPDNIMPVLGLEGGYHNTPEEAFKAIQDVLHAKNFKR